MKNTYIRIVTSVGLIAILALQVIWLYNTYSLIKVDITGKANELLEKAINYEVSLRFANAPKGTAITSSLTDTKESISQRSFKSGISDLNEGLSKIGLIMSLNKIDSIYRILLKEANLSSKDLNVTLLSPKDNKIIQVTSDAKQYNTVITELCYIRYDKSEAIQATLLNPYWILFQRMGLLMIATVILTIFVIGCIIYQIRIINLQNKIAKMREDFSYAMIHDMKTPLTSILMGTHILHSGKLTEQQKIDKHFRIVEEETKHLLSLTNKVLTISKLEKHQLELEKDIVPLKHMIADLIEKFSAKSAKATFTTRFQTDSVYADSEYLKEAISNLIDNSIKYSGTSVNIEISAEDTNDEYTLIKVKDDGNGIALEDQKKIFEKFERAAAFGRTRKGGASGFGLGLNYVQNITEAHGGRVLLESIENQFSEFQLYIPHSTK